MTQNIPLAVALVIVGSFCFALSAHLQHNAVDGELSGNASKTRMKSAALWQTIRKPRWLLGLAAMGVSAVFQIIALTMAPVSVVQPVGLLAFPWSVLLAARATKTWVPPRTMSAVIVTVLATLAFTVITGIHATAESDLVVRRVVVGAIVVYAVAALFSLMGASGPFAWRCLFWSSGGALFYGLEAALVKSLLEYAKTHSWPFAAVFWGICVALVIGAVMAGWLIQQGYATGPAEVVVGSMTVTSPVVAVAFGILVLGEGRGISLWGAISMIALGLIAIAGVAALTRFHPTYAIAAPVEEGSTAASAFDVEPPKN